MKSDIYVRRFAGAAIHTTQLVSSIRIAHLTDIHVGRLTPLTVQKAAVVQTNLEQPDLVVITGDFVCYGQKYLDALEEVVRGFDAPVVAVLGNHDHWSGPDEVRRALRRAGAAVLDNAWTEFFIRGERLQLVGVDDPYTGHADPVRATRGLDPRIATLGLSHVGELADHLWPRGVPLVLAGHTHAGQITVARMHELLLGRIGGHRYIHGLYGTRKELLPDLGAVYVGAGVGSSSVTFRLGDRAQRELTVFELGAEVDRRVEPLLERPMRPKLDHGPSLARLARRKARVERRKAKRARRAMRRLASEWKSE